nr:MAG TPA: hypothetical protein [Caudoviricetes sp.]
MNSCESIGFKVLLKLYEDTQRQKARYFYIVRMLKPSRFSRKKLDFTRVFGLFAQI